MPNAAKRHQIGIIQSFDPTTCTAVVKIAMTKVVGLSVITYPLLATVPVIFPRGGTGFITFPIATGDEALVLFNDRDIDAWWESGQDTANPNSPRQHDLSDALCFVGPVSKPNADLLQYSTTNILLGFPGSLFSIGPTGTTITTSGVTIAITGSSVTITTAGGVLTLSSSVATMAFGTTEVSMATSGGPIAIHANGTTLAAIMDALMFALEAWQNSDGTGPNLTTETRLVAVRASLAAFLT